MTQGRIGGPMLRDNLVRNGVDLSFETNLLYFDVNNMRIGINQSAPAVLLDVNGVARIGNVQASGNTISTVNTNGNLTITPNGTGNVLLSTATANRVIYAGANKELLTSANLTFDGTTLVITTANSTTTNAGNIQITSNTISSTNTNGNISLTPNGTGNIILSTTTANRILYTGTNKEALTNSNLTFDGSNLVLTGTANATTINAGNIQISNNNIASTTGNVILNPAANVILNTATANRLFYSGANKEVLTNSNLTFDGSTLTAVGQFNIDNIRVDGNSITSTDTNGNINLDPDGTGRVKVIGTNAFTLPTGTLAERPTGVIGDIRISSESGYLEYFDGTNWQVVTGSSTTIASDSFNGDGVTVNFTLSQAGTSNSTFVSVNGVVQKPSTAYTVSGTTLTFVEAPATGDVIDVRMLKSIVDVTFINDGDTSIMVYDSTQKADIAINGNLVLSVTNAALLPGSNLTYDIGSTSLRWKTVYANTLVSSVATGTAPFTVTSTTQVANLNVAVAGSLVNGNSNVTIAANANVNISSAGTANVLVVTNTGANIAGTLNATGNANVANLGVTNGTLTTTAATVNIFNVTPTTINFGGNATTMSIGKAGSTVTFNGNVADGIGNLRSIPQNSQTAAYVLAATDNGKHISTNANVTVPNTIFSAGQTISVYNNSAANINIVQDAGVTMYLAGTATTGNRTLQQRGIATVLCVAANTFVVTGAGLT